MQFMGFDGFVWFTGVVEDRRDPMALGRCKVRIAGLHTEKMTPHSFAHLLIVILIIIGNITYIFVNRKEDK